LAMPCRRFRVQSSLKSSGELSRQIEPISPFKTKAGPGT
jgi:hypothetical protein